MILFVSLVFVSIGLMIDEFGTNYIDRNISSAERPTDSFDDEFDRIDELNASLAPLQEQFNNIDQGDQQNIIEAMFQGAVLFPLAIITLPQIMFQIVAIGTGFVTTLSVDILQIPEPILYMAIVGIFAFILLLIVTFARRFNA